MRGFGRLRAAGDKRCLNTPVLRGIINLYTSTHMRPKKKKEEKEKREK